MKPAYQDDIYLGTVLVEVNRWGGDRIPSVRVSDWSRRIADAGFDGVELWQNHALLATGEERDALKEGPSPVRIFNAYDTCGNETIDVRRECAELVRFFGAEGMKYNLGRDAERFDEYCVNLRAWREMLPRTFRLLCECHRGTALAVPAEARETLQRLGLPGSEVIVHGFGGDEADIVNRFKVHGEHITHIHANLSYRCKLSPAQVQQRVDLLRSLGFCGSFTIEFAEGVRSEDENSEVLFTNAVRDLELLKRCLG